MLASKFEAVLIVITILSSASASPIACPTGSSLIPNCATCVTSSSSIVCNTCINGYYLASTTCVQCSSVIPNCNICSLNIANQPICSICITNYGLLNGACLNCSAISGCATCQILNNNLACTACNTDLVLYTAQTQCIPCQIPNCNDCSISNSGNFTCSACKMGYYLSNNICTACSLNISYCASCQFDQNGKLICSSCASTELYLSNNTCYANCSRSSGYTYCSLCQLVSLSANTMTCSACIPNYYIDPSTKNCLLCSSAIAGCTNCSYGSSNNALSVVSCTACTSAYFLASNPSTCVLCSSIKPNCQTCNFDFSSQNGQCSSCASGYYLNNTDQACYTCSNSATILQFPANSCSVCSNNGSAIICSACISDYYLANNYCLSCGDKLSNCLSCSFTSIFTCLTCINGYLITSSGQCSLCSTIYPNCRICNTLQCTDCLAGYYTIDNRVCVKNCVLSNCIQCASQDNLKCSVCNTGYTLNNQFTCSIMVCNSPLGFNGIACVCSATNYYEVSSNKCRPCSDTGCLLCPNNICTECMDGYFSQNSSSCTKCMANCEYCNSIANCYLCEEGYNFASGSCQAFNQLVIDRIGIVYSSNYYKLCGKGCIQCDAISCKSCSVGYFLNGTTCSQCPNNCKICYLGSTTVSSAVCVVCQSGLALINHTCSSCRDVNCVRCDYNSYFCLLCSIKYTADANGICLLCASNCNFCDIGGPGTCDDDSCFLGYAKYNLTQCIRCLNGCSSCNGTTPYTCIGCLLGSYASKASNGLSCDSCAYGCTSCTGPKACTSCSINYKLVNQVCILACQLPCVLCSFSNGAQICQTCLQGYSLSNGTCLPNFSCMGSNICEFCPLSYFAYRGSCYLCPSNCFYCIFSPNDPSFAVSGTNYISYLNCTQCASSFYLDSSMICQSCAVNCNACLSLAMCTKCNPAFFLEYKLLNGISGLNYSVGICKSCSLGCYQCEIQPNRCISCKTGFYLTNFICYSFQNVTFSFTLVSSNENQSTLYQNIAGKLADLEYQIANIFGSIFSQNSYLVMVNSIANGSVIVGGTAAIDNSTTDPSNTYNTMSSNVQQTSTLNGYQIASSSLTANGFTPSSTASQSTSYLIYIIIGAAVLAVAMLVLVACLYRRYRRKKKEEEELANTQKVDTENQPVTSKNMLKNVEVSQGRNDYSSKPRKVKGKKMNEISEIGGNKQIPPVDSLENKESQKLSRYDKRSKRQIDLGKIVKSNNAIREQYQQQQQENNYQYISKPRVPDKQYQQQEYIEISRNKSKSAKMIRDELVHQPTINYKSSKNINIPTRDYQIRQIELLKNQSNFDEEQKTEKIKQTTSKKGKNQSNSISQKYIPNNNSHFI